MSLSRRFWSFFTALATLGCAARPNGQAWLQAQRAMESDNSRTGNLWLRCEPLDALVLLDGVSQGTCGDFTGEPRGLSVGHGLHKIEFRKEGFWPFETSYDAGGAKANLSVKLVPRKSGPQGG